jgi:hypothetical protein
VCLREQRASARPRRTLSCRPRSACSRSDPVKGMAGGHCAAIIPLLAHFAASERSHPCKGTCCCVVDGPRQIRGAPLERHAAVVDLVDGTVGLGRAREI